MTIRYTCEECGSVLNIKDEKAGTQGRCPKCKAEFLIPTAGEAAAAAVEAPSDAARQPAASDAAAESSAAKSKQPVGSLSDDEIGQLLQSKEGPADRDDYIVADEDDDDDEYDDDDYEDDDLDDDEEDEEEPSLGVPSRGRKGGGADGDDVEEEIPPARDKKKRRREATPAPQSSLSASGIAQGLMGRGEKAGKAELREEKKGKRLFGAGGEHERDRGDEEGFTLQEKIKYFGAYAIPIIIGVGVGVLLYMWYMARWQRGEIPNLAAVSGTVMLDGLPLARAEVHFHPIQVDPKKPVKQSSSIGFTDTSGRYTLTYVASAQGAVPGKHRVQIYATDEKGQPIIPALYNLRTTLTADVKPEGNPDINFELSSKAQEGGAGAGSFNPRGR